MNMDSVEALELLREHSIHVARTRYVDSGEDAIFFAEGRPITLRVVVSGNGAVSHPSEGGLRQSEAIRQAYERLVSAAHAHAGGQVLAQHEVGVGTDIAIEGRDDPSIGRIVELRCGERRVYRLHPLTEDLSTAMLSEFHSKNGIAAGEKATHMLSHLLLRVSELFSDDAIESMLLSPIRLHDNTYHVLNAVISAKRALPLNKRLDKHAHDKKAAYHP